MLRDEDIELSVSYVSQRIVATRVDKPRDQIEEGGAWEIAFPFGKAVTIAIIKAAFVSGGSDAKEGASTIG